MWIDSSGENKSAYLCRQSFRLLNAFSSKQCVALQWGAHQYCSVVLWRGGEQGCVSLGTLEVALSTHVPLLHQTNVRLDTFCYWIIGFASHQPPGQFDALATGNYHWPYAVLAWPTTERFTPFVTCHRVILADSRWPGGKKTFKLTDVFFRSIVFKQNIFCSWLKFNFQRL